MKKLLPLFLIFCFILGCDKKLSDSPQTNYELDKIQNIGELCVRILSPKTEYQLWETIDLIVEASCSPKIDVEIGLDDKDSSYKVLSKQPITERIDDRANLVRGVKFVIEPMHQGSLTIDNIAVNYDQQTNKIEPVKFDIISSISDSKNQELSDIKNVVNIPFRIGFVGWVVIIIILLLFVLICVYLFTLKKKKYNTPLKVKRPDEIALERIENLLLLKLIEAGRLEEFYGRLCNILRYYIEDCFNVKAAEMTTDEFLQDIKQKDILDIQDKLKLQDFLTHCDLVKFAKAQVSGEKVQDSVDMAKSFINKTADTMVKEEVL